MLFSDRPRTHYEKPLAHEVISLPIFRRLSGRTFPSTPADRTNCRPGW